MSDRSIYQRFERVVRDNGSGLAYRHKRDGRWCDLTWSEHRERVRAVTRALLALDVARGERVGILSQTRLEWVQADVGIMNAGAVTVGVYPSEPASACAFILQHAEVGVLFVEDGGQLGKIMSVAQELPALRCIVRFDGPQEPGRSVLSWSEFLRRGDGIGDERLAVIGESIGPEDLASIVYTSGTTGVPKGAMITHRNLLSATDSAAHCLGAGPGHVTLLFLPLAHVYARLIAHLFMGCGGVVAFAEDMGHIAANLKEIRPDFIASVPRVYEKVRETVLATVESASPLKRRLFHWALLVGVEAGRHRQRREALPPGLRLRHALADRLVLRKVRAAFGGRMTWCVSGAAPLNTVVAEFFQACGVTILEGLGMTENTSFSNVNRRDSYRFGTVGPVGPGIEMKIAHDGEVLFRGDNVMKGYFKDPEATAAAIDADGWLHSGDVGEIDPDGHLRITDRKKDLFITAGGKNVAPQRIERVLRESPYISQAMAYGDRRKYLTALITLETSRVREWAQARGLHVDGDQELANHPRVHELISEEVRRLNGSLASFETIKRFRILPRDFSVEQGEVTPTLKLRRKALVARYGDLLEQLYES